MEMYFVVFAVFLAIGVCSCVFLVKLVKLCFLSDGVQV